MSICNRISAVPRAGLQRFDNRLSADATFVLLLLLLLLLALLLLALALLLLLLVSLLLIGLLRFRGAVGVSSCGCV